MPFERSRTTQYTSRPGVIDFAIGQPNPELLPLSLMRDAAADRFVDDKARDYLAYGHCQGDGFTRDALARLLGEQQGSAIDPETLMITNGVSGTLDLICTLFASQGATVFVEEPTYFIALEIFKNHRLEIVSVPTDAQGLNVDALEEMLARRDKCDVPAFVYTIPTFHNPAGMTMPHERRQQLADLAQTYDLLVVADEVYQLLGYDEQPPRPVAAYDERADVISMGSFSKILAPGLRLGWIQAPTRIVKSITSSGLLRSGGGLNPFTSAVVRSALESGALAAHIAMLRTEYASRMHALTDELQCELGDAVAFTPPAGGYFTWLQINGDVDARSLVDVGRKQGVNFSPGSNFSGSDGLHNCMRLCFAWHDESELREGVRRLAHVIGAK